VNKLLIALPILFLVVSLIPIQFADALLEKYLNLRLARWVNPPAKQPTPPEQDKGLIGNGHGPVLEIDKIYQNEFCAKWSLFSHDKEEYQVHTVIFYTPGDWDKYSEIYGDIHNNFKSVLRNMTFNYNDHVYVEQCDSRGISEKIRASMWVFIVPKVND